MLAAMAAISKVPALGWAQVVTYGGFVKFDGCYADFNFSAVLSVQPLRDAFIKGEYFGLWALLVLTSFGSSSRTPLHGVSLQ